MKRAKPLRECVNHLLIWQLMQSRPSLDDAACDQSVETKEKPWGVSDSYRILIYYWWIVFLKGYIVDMSVNPFTWGPWCDIDVSDIDVWVSGSRKLPICCLSFTIYCLSSSSTYQFPTGSWFLHMHHVHELSQRKMSSEGWQLCTSELWEVLVLGGTTMKVINSRDFPVKSASNFQAAWT